MKNLCGYDIRKHAHVHTQAQRKTHMLSNQKPTVQVKTEVPSASKMTPPAKPPKPAATSAPLPDRKKSSSAAKAGTKRKKGSSQTESDYEDDEEFKVWWPLMVWGFLLMKSISLY